jgi:glycerol uptake facilitator-like aquaporin
MRTLPLIAEFLGTFFLLLSILVTGNFIVIGGALAAIVFLIGGISGGHVNPAVSLAFYMKGTLSMTELLSYVAVQLAGGAGALAAVRALA